MAKNAVYKFPTIDVLTAFLNGAVFGNNGRIGANAGGGFAHTPNTPGFPGLVGKTLTLVAPGPAGTVTFVAANVGSGSSVAPGTNPDPYNLLLKDVKAQIEAAIAGVVVSMSAGYIQIIETTPTNGVTVQGGAGAANSANVALGFDGNNSSVGKLYKPVEVSPTAPCWTWSDTDNNGSLVIFTWE
jgi:hypothetical protein